MNVAEIEENVQELASKGFKPDTFILDFVKAYDAPKALIQQLKGGHQNLSDVDGAVLWRRNLHYKLAPKGQVAAFIAELERSKVVAEFKIYIVKASLIEKLLQTCFDKSHADITIEDKFGKPVRSTEWFFVPPNTKKRRRRWADRWQSW